MPKKSKKPSPPPPPPSKTQAVCKKGCEIACAPCIILACFCDVFASLTDPGYVSPYYTNVNTSSRKK